MKTSKKLFSLLLVLCLMLSISVSAFAKNYTVSEVFKGLSGILPKDSLTLPDNTIWATITACWGVKVIFVDWDETELKSETVPVSDTKPGSSHAPEDPTRHGYRFVGWERHDTNGDEWVTLHDDGSVTEVTGPGPIVYIALYEKIPSGNLTVSKAIAGNGADSDKTFDFTVTLGDTSVNGTYGDMSFTDGVATFSLKGGESATAENLPAGKSYTVTEADYSAEGYETTMNGDTGTIKDGVAATAAFTNKRMVYGNLTVSKAIAGNGAGRDKAFEFTVTLGDTAINGTFGSMNFKNGVSTFSLKGGESKTAENLPAGISYAVIETDYSAEGYETTKSGDTGTIKEGETAIAAFTNTRMAYGDLTVSKAVAGNAADSSKAFDFTVTLSDTAINGTYGDMSFKDGVATFTLKDGESATATRLPAGISYTVTEADYSAEGYETTKRGDTGAITDGVTETADFTNTRMVYGDLSISKNVTGNLGDRSKYFTFKVEFDVEGTFSYTGSTSGTIASGGTIQLKNGESVTIHDIPAGTHYKVTESGSSGYSVYASGDTGIILEDTALTAIFTNSRSNVPKTGDDDNTPLWFSMMGISVLGMAATRFGGSNKRRKGAHRKNK